MAQPSTVTLDEAVSMAVERSPRMKVAAADIKKSRAMRGESWDGVGTQVGFAWGQLNGEEKNDNESICRSLYW